MPQDVYLFNVTADRIVALDAGHVAETGTHDELLSANGYYAHLVASQRGGLVGMPAGQIIVRRSGAMSLKPC